MQHKIMQKCDCFDAMLDMSLMNVSKFPFVEGVRPCEFGLLIQYV